MHGGMCKPDYGIQKIFRKRVYFIGIIKKPCLCNGNRPITKMGVADAFEQFRSRFFSLFFINNWVYAQFLGKACHVDNEDWKTSCSNANMYCAVCNYINVAQNKKLKIVNYEFKISHNCDITSSFLS